MNLGLPGVGVGQTEKKFTERKEMYKGRCSGVFCFVFGGGGGRETGSCKVVH